LCVIRGQLCIDGVHRWRMIWQYSDAWWQTLLQ
jgi:hypothetical protein